MAQCVQQRGGDILSVSNLTLQPFSEAWPAQKVRARSGWATASRTTPTPFELKESKHGDGNDGDPMLQSSGVCTAEER